MADTTFAIPTVGLPTQGNIDVAQVTNPSLTATVMRENVVLADPNNFVGQAQATFARGLMADTSLYDTMQQILIELRLHSQLMAIGFNITDDLDNWRADPTNLQQTPQ